MASFQKLLEDQDPNVRRATGAQIKAYFQRVLEKHLASRRVQFYGQYSYNESTNEIRSIMGGETHKLKWNRKLVDTSFLTSPVPSVNPPSFHVEDTPERKFCPVNCISKIHGGNNLLTMCMIICDGKTSMDATVFIEQVVWFNFVDTHVKRGCFIGMMMAKMVLVVYVVLVKEI